MLSVFILYSVFNIIAIDKYAFIDLFYSSPYIIDLNQWFLAYGVVDMIFMILYKNGRLDLWIHHIMFVIGVIIFYKNFGTNLVLLGEALSLFSGIDLYYIKNNMMYKSYLCKKIRKTIILYLRLPIWIFIFISNTLYLILFKFTYYYLVIPIVVPGILFLDYTC